MSVFIEEEGSGVKVVILTVVDGANDSDNGRRYDEVDIANEDDDKKEVIITSDDAIMVVSTAVTIVGDGNVYTELVDDFSEDISNVNAEVVSNVTSAVEVTDDAVKVVVVDSIDVII